MYKEYMNDGITKNIVDFKKINIVGYLFNYVSKLDDVIPQYKNIPLRSHTEKMISPLVR
jgi:hypothetical protein